MYKFVNEVIYYVDENGFLLDKNSVYLQNERNEYISISENIKDLLKERAKISIIK